MHSSCFTLEPFQRTKILAFKGIQANFHVLVCIYWLICIYPYRRPWRLLAEEVVAHISHSQSQSQSHCHSHGYHHLLLLKWRRGIHDTWLITLVGILTWSASSPTCFRIRKRPIVLERSLGVPEGYDKNFFKLFQLLHHFIQQLIISCFHMNIEFVALLSSFTILYCIVLIVEKFFMMSNSLRNSIWWCKAYGCIWKLRLYS